MFQPLTSLIEAPAAATAFLAASIMMIDLVEFGCRV